MKRSIKSIIAATAAIFMCAVPMAASFSNIMTTSSITASAYYYPNAFASFADNWTPEITGVSNLNQRFNLGHVDYELDLQHQTAKIVGMDRADSKIKIPACIKINGTIYEVASIENGAFKNKDGKRLPNGEAAPMGAALVQFDLSAATHLKTIGNEAFQNCTSLESIVIPASVSTIGTKAFQNTGIRTLRLNRISAYTYASLTINDLAFANCTKLTSITNNVTRFGSSSSDAFKDCHKSNITIGTTYRVSGYKAQFIDHFKTVFGF